MKKEYLLVFVVFLIICFGNLANLCRIYFPLGFDGQVLTSWQFSASIGQFPIRDIFYPYGFLSFYKGHNIFFSILYILTLPFLFTVNYFLFKTALNSRVKALLSILLLFIFIVNITGFEYFARYGILPSFAGWSAINLWKSKKLSVRFLYFAGIITGIIYPLVSDQGLYAAVALIALLAIWYASQFKKSKFVYTLKVFCKNVVVYFSGVFTIIIPFLVFLYQTGSLGQFINSFTDLSNLEELAKTPYFNGALTFDNIFTIAILILSITYVLYEILKRTKISLSLALLISWIVSLVILEQKSIVRINDAQLTFVGFILLTLLAFDIFDKYVKKNRVVFYFPLLGVFLALIFLAPLRSLNWSGGPYNCGNRFDIKEKKYSQVVSELKKDKDFDGKIFSYPGDTIFYVMLKQSPPYYPTSFEASSIEAQHKLIEYIKTNNINFVLYNHTNLAIQDGVPNYVRTSALNKYILSSFQPDKVVGDFIILKKGKGDFISDSKINGLTSFKNYLLNVNLENIPRSEGEYKSKYLTKPLVSGTISEINKYLQENETSSKDKILSIDFDTLIESKSNVVIKTSDGFETSISFNFCPKDYPCIINLSNIPLFYENRVLSSIVVDSEVAQIKIYSTVSAELW